MGKGGGKSSARGGGSNSSGNTRQLRQFGSDEYDTPFPTGDKSDANEIARFALRIGKYSDEPPVNTQDLPIQNVKLSDLTRHQDQLSKSTVDSLMRLSIKELNSGKAGIPWVIKYNNTYQIQDGHHRLSALWAKEAKTARVRVFDLNKLTNRNSNK